LRECLVTDRPLTRIAETSMKLWPVGSVAQSAIQAALDARRQVGDLSRIAKVRVFAEEGAYDHLVRIRKDPWNPISRETADHSLPYIVAAAVLDGEITAESFDLDRVLDPQRRAFLNEKVSVEPDPELGTIASGKLKRAEMGYLSRVEIDTVDGKTVTGPAVPFPGHPKNPFSRQVLEAKMRENIEPVVGARADEIISAVFAFDTLDTVRHFASLLAFDADAADSVAA
jgi:2-methylcitrate dehydratase